MPWMLNAFFKLITPFIDPVTKDKIRFNPKVIHDGLFTEDNVWKSFGGKIDFKYEHEVYWPHFIEYTNERKNKLLESWRALGGKVGLKEWDIKQAVVSAEEKEGEAKA